MISLFTYEDAIGHALDYLGVNVSDQASRDCARAVQNAYRELADAFTWSYLYKEGFFITTPTYPPGAIDVIPNVIPSPWGTIEYLHSSGLHPFQVTLTGGEWPVWADRGAWLRFSNPPPDVDTGVAVTDFVSYRVAKRWSTAVLELDPVINPGRDAPAGTYFVLYRDTYLLPEDYIAQDRAMFSIYPWTMEYVHPNTWLRETRYVFARGNPRNYCVPSDHEILTKRGWSRYEDLTVGEDVLAYNHQTGELAWQALDGVYDFDFDGDLMTLERRGKKFLFTENHRWPVVMRYGGRSKMLESNQLTGATFIPRTGDFRGEDSVLSPRLAAILGWAVTDGSQLFNPKGHWNATVAQSPKKHLDKVVALLGTKPRKANKISGVCNVGIASEDRAAIRKVIRSKQELPSLVCRLSRDAAEAMLAAMFMAEGWTMKSKQKGFAQYHPDNRPVIEAFQILCTMTGKWFDLHDGSDGRMSGTICRSKFLNPSKNGGLGRERYKGKIWCPKTPWGTWVMRHDGCVMITGNTITGDDNYYPGRLVIRLYPWPIDERSVTYIYKRRPRPLRLYRVSTGTVTGVAGTNVLTASQAAFTPKMVQAVVRLSLTPGTPPTGPVGFNPPDFESVIIRFNSSTEVELADPLDVDYTNVPYTVSDRVDVEEVMRTALLRGIEKQIGMSRVLKDKQDSAAQYDMALREAKAADSRSLMGRSVGDAHWFRRRLRDYPIQLGHTT